MKTTEYGLKDLEKLVLPAAKSHKGDNGRVLVIGGSSLFHSASLWAAELLAHFVDLVFYYSPEAINQKICLDLKRQFRNGIVVVKNDLDNYIREADVILIGPGLMREGREGKLAAKLTNQLLSKYDNHKFVIDAGALQQLDLVNLHKQHLLTPHWLEFTNLFAKYRQDFDKLLVDYPSTYLIKKNGVDYVLSWQNPDQVIRITLGNEGLTKGGSGDLLAALACAFYVKNPADLSAATASFVLNSAASDLYKQVGPFYTTTELLSQIPKTFWRLLKNQE